MRAVEVVILVAVFATAIADGSDAIDFRQFYRAAQDILDGDNPYPGPDAHVVPA